MDFDIVSYLLGKKRGGGSIGVKYEVVEELPTIGEDGFIYLVPKTTSLEDNVYNEYMYINDNWELIGDTEADLTDYVKNTDYASTQDAGVIKATENYGVSMQSSGQMYATNSSYQTYQNASQGYFVGKGTLENVIAGKGLQTQYNTMPTASLDNLGQIVQYTGTTDSTYTNGYFYECVSDGGDPETYSWENINVQAGGGSVSEGLPTYLVGSPSQTSSVDIPLENLKVGIYKPQFERTSVRLTLNDSPKMIFELVGDLIVLKDYSEAQNDEIFAIVKNWDDGRSPKIANYYLKKTSSGVSYDYSRIGNIPNSGNDIYINSLENTGVATQWTFNVYAPQCSVAPTVDNNLTNKKYVDDLATTYAGYDATKTQVLKNINGTLTWVDEV